MEACACASGQVTAPEATWPAGDLGRVAQASRDQQQLCDPQVMSSATQPASEMGTMPSEQQLSPNYTFMFPFERNFQYSHTSEWMAQYWHTSFYAAALYLVAVFAGRALMHKRPAYRLQPLLTAWNLSLALFSITGTLRTLPELLHVLRRFGFHHSACHPTFVLDVKPSGFWSWMFVLSKIPELGDTAFIVLRKQNLQFLHWYHHVTVLLFTWYAWFTEGVFTGPSRWFIDMNYLVHSLMYSYYALKSLGLRIPKPMAMLITIAQILQMVGGASVISYAYYRKSLGDTCSISRTTAAFGLIMYLSYFCLFARFFYISYFSRPLADKASSRSSRETIKRD